MNPVFHDILKCIFQVYKCHISKMFSHNSLTNIIHHVYVHVSVQAFTTVLVHVYKCALTCMPGAIAQPHPTH